LRSHLRPDGSSPGTGTPSVARAQLQLPFALEADAPAAGPPPPDSQSRREFRPPEAAKQVRAARSEADNTQAVAAALGLYLPPGKTLELRLTNNHYSMISVRRKQDGYRLRLHHMFVSAGPRIVRALARYVVHNDRRASALLGEYIEEHQHIIRKQVRPPRQVKMRTAGQHHDLQAIFDRLNSQRFEGQLQARITWGPVAERKQLRQSIKMGSFAVEDRIIRIHPVLDHATVPEYFVSWIVFHEMLHGKHEVRRKDGRRRFHTKEFLAEERTFADYDRASAWEKANLDRLLRA
jgi:predicted metal-dependent hydrolase